MAWTATKNAPTASPSTALDIHIDKTPGRRAVRLWTKTVESIHPTKAGFRPTASIAAPSRGDNTISPTAAPDAKNDSVEVAFSWPMALINAGAGDNATIATKMTKTATSLVMVVLLLHSLPFPTTGKLADHHQPIFLIVSFQQLLMSLLLLVQKVVLVICLVSLFCSLLSQLVTVVAPQPGKF
jgi:hypothetical protein